MKTVVITNPMPESNKSAEITLSKLLRVLRGVRSHIFLAGANISLEEDIREIDIFSVNMNRSRNKLLRLLSIIWIQIRISLFVLKNIDKSDEVIFWLGDKMLLPFWTVKIKKATSYYFVYGNLAKEDSEKISSKISSALVVYMANHADYACCESASVIDSWEGRIKNERKIMHLYTDEIEMFPIGSRREVVGMICRVAGVKHVIECIEAFVQFHEVYPGWSLEILGTGKQYDECKKIIDVNHAEDYIIMPGWIPRTEIKQYSKKWKWYLSASDHEGLPNGLIEMMGSGIPAIAHPVGGIPDVLEDGVSGYYLDGVTVSEILEGLKKAVLTENYDLLAESAYRTISSKFTLGAAQADMEKAFR